MPITAKFSKAFYDKLGHGIADEMVDWFNQADAVYRMQLRELNDLNYARFEAKVDQRFAELDAKWEARIATIDQRLAELDAKWEARFATIFATIDQRFGEQDRKRDKSFAALDTRIEAVQGGLVKWMFVFWAPTALSVVALAVAALR